MTFQVYRAGRLSEAHERIQMNKLLEYLEGEFGRRDEDCNIIIEPSIPTSSDGTSLPGKPDALIIKDNIFVLIELKAFEGEISADCAPGAIWRSKDGIELEEPSRINPFNQARNHRIALLEFLAARIITEPNIPPWVKRDDNSVDRWMERFVQSWVVTGEGSFPSMIGRDPRTVPFFRVLAVEKVPENLTLFRSNEPLLTAPDMKHLFGAFNAKLTSRSEWFRGAQIESREESFGIIPKIARWIDSGNYENIEKSLKYIRELDLKRHLPHVIRIWRENQYPSLRRSALELLIDWQEGNTGQFLDEALQHEDARIVSFALDHLSKYGYDEPIGTLSKMLGDDPNPTYVNIINALAASGHETVGSNILEFGRKNFDTRPFKDFHNWHERADQVIHGEFDRLRYEEFGRLEQRRMFLHKLCRAVIDSFADLNCRESIPWLKRIIDEPTSLGFEAVDYSELFRLHSDYYGIFSSACRSLGRLGKGDGTVTELLLGKLGTAPEDFQYCIIMALGDLGDKRAAPALMKFVSCEDPDLHARAISSLGNIRAEDAYNLLEALYEKSYRKDDQESEIETDLLEEALMKIDSVSFEGTLDKLLSAPASSTDLKRRQELFWTLNKVVTSRSTGLLIAILGDKDLSEQAAISLSLINSDKVKAKGRELANSFDPHQRALGVQILYYHFKTHVDELVPFESDASSEVRTLVAAFYESFGEISKLTNLANDSDEDIRKIVFFGLRKRSRMEVGFCQLSSLAAGPSTAEILVSDFGLAARLKDRLLLIPYQSITRLAQVRGRGHIVALYIQTRQNNLGVLLLAPNLHHFIREYEEFRDSEASALFKALRGLAGLNDNSCKELGEEELRDVRNLWQGVATHIGTKVPITLEELS